MVHRMHVGAKRPGAQEPASPLRRHSARAAVADPAMPIVLLLAAGAIAFEAGRVSLIWAIVGALAGYSLSGST